jgi:hypothetical protein
MDWEKLVAVTAYDQSAASIAPPLPVILQQGTSLFCCGFRNVMLGQDLWKTKRRN